MIDDMTYGAYAGQKVRVNSFVTRVFQWMGGSLAITAIVALLVARTPAVYKTIFENPALLIGLVIAELAMVVAISWGINRISAATAGVLLVLYSAVNGLTLSVIFLVYTATSVTATFFVCAGLFAVMSIYGYVTKKDLTAIGSLCIMGLVGIIIASIVNMFVASSGMYWAITYIGVFVFIGLTAYDTQKIKQMALSVDGQQAGETAQKAAILGALALYLDFINLFLLLLRLLGRER